MSADQTTARRGQHVLRASRRGGVLSPWSLAFSYSAPLAEVDEAICAVVFPEHREGTNCG